MLHEFQVEENVHIFLMAHLCRSPTRATCGNDVNDSGMGGDKFFEHPARKGYSPGGGRGGRVEGDGAVGAPPGQTGGTCMFGNMTNGKGGPVGFGVVPGGVLVGGTSGLAPC